MSTVAQLQSRISVSLLSCFQMCLHQGPPYSLHTMKCQRFDIFCPWAPHFHKHRPIKVAAQCSHNQQHSHKTGSSGQPQCHQVTKCCSGTGWHQPGVVFGDREHISSGESAGGATLMTSVNWLTASSTTSNVIGWRVVGVLKMLHLQRLGVSNLFIWLPYTASVPMHFSLSSYLFIFLVYWSETGSGSNKGITW